MLLMMLLSHQTDIVFYNTTVNPIIRKDNIEYFETTCDLNSNKDWKFTDECANTYVMVSVHTRARFGYSIMAISSSNSSFENALILISKMGGQLVNTGMLKGTKNTTLKGLSFLENNDGLWVPNNITVCNEIPFGVLVNDTTQFTT